MNNKKIKLAGSLLLGIVIIAIYFWMLSGPDLREVTDEFKIIIGDKNVVTGIITEAKAVDQEVEKSNGDVEIACGFAYTYSFQTMNNQVIQSTGWNYGELPLEKNLEDIPYHIDVEYLTMNPNLHRVHGLWSNNESLWEWFRHKVFGKFIIFCLCICTSYYIIRSAIVTYKLNP